MDMHMGSLALTPIPGLPDQSSMVLQQWASLETTMLRQAQYSSVLPRTPALLAAPGLRAKI